VPAAIKKNGLPEGINPTVKFDLDKFDSNIFNSLSEGIQNKIKQSPEWARVNGSSNTSVSADVANFDDMESDLPF
jgi:hypothetical protein